MIYIKRSIESEVQETNGTYAQASFNSDGVLTLRKYSKDAKNDEIIIFSRSETDAILRLFEMMKDNARELPF